jgi:lipid-binding SYLF domain-containing protein
MSRIFLTRSEGCSTEKQPRQIGGFVSTGESNRWRYLFYLALWLFKDNFYRRDCLKLKAAQRRPMRNYIATALIAASAIVAPNLQAQAPDKLVHRIDAAHAILHELMNTPDKGIPLDIAASAQCVIVVPAFKKAAFVFGGEYGQGVATCRTGHGWSAPVFVQMAGGSFGFQVGGQSTDLVLIGRSHKSLDHLLKDKVKLGGDASVAGGPVGRSAQASTTELANAEFLTYSRNKGLFAGIDLQGDEVNQNKKDTAEFYGHDIAFEKVLSGAVPTPPAAAHFVATAGELFHRARVKKATN